MQQRLAQDKMSSLVEAESIKGHRHGDAAHPASMSSSIVWTGSSKPFQRLCLPRACVCRAGQVPELQFEKRVFFPDFSLNARG
mmetsp:Transcript_45797/g.109043  ORF Transcript_45797/g.109043 Transcript_45797/m.109043 type:complete len:83 (+) Transcript_45797:265-513(+)